MSWTDPETKSTGNLITAAYWNQMLGPSGNQVLTAPGVFTTAGDIIYGTGDNATTRLPSSGESLKFLRMNAGETAPEYATALTSLVADTTPQLGGQLDVNGNAIGDGTLELLKFSETGSAVNELTITNAATGNPPALSATGGDANINLKLAGKGTGGLEIGATATTASKLILAEDTDNGVHTITVAAPAAVTGDITLTLPDGDGDADQFLQTDGDGALSWAAAGGGLTEADSWRLTTSFTGDADPIASNLGGVISDGYARLGTGMSESSGIFTFPSTGYWAVLAMFGFAWQGNSRYNQGFIQVTVNADNGNTYSTHTMDSTALTQFDNEEMSGTVTLYGVVDVTDTAAVKVRFKVSVENDGTTVEGGADNRTSFHFLRLGDR